MEIKKTIQVIYAPGCWGHAVRWMLDRFSPQSRFKGIDSPWDSADNVHGFKSRDYNPLFKRGHQLDGRFDSPDPDADKIILSYEPLDILFVERCRFYRNPGMRIEHNRYNDIIARADKSFVKKTFGENNSSKSVAKELTKIQFHDSRSHAWWGAMNKFNSEKEHYKLKMENLWDNRKLVEEFKNIDKKYKLELDIDEKVIANVVDKISKEHVVQTKNRAFDVLTAISSGTNMACGDLDIMEQAYIETELEKANDCIIFPYGTNWFEHTNQITEFIDTYPTYLKHMNPRLPWYNNIKNPYHVKHKLTDKGNVI